LFTIAIHSGDDRDATSRPTAACAVDASEEAAAPTALS
jgi:hypothetical protein